MLVSLPLMFSNALQNDDRTVTYPRVRAWRFWIFGALTAWCCRKSNSGKHRKAYSSHNQEISNPFFPLSSVFLFSCMPPVPCRVLYRVFYCRIHGQDTFFLLDHICIIRIPLAVGIIFTSLYPTLQFSMCSQWYSTVPQKPSRQETHLTYLLEPRNPFKMPALAMKVTQMNHPNHGTQGPPPPSPSSYFLLSAVLSYTARLPNSTHADTLTIHFNVHITALSQPGLP